MKNRYKQLVWDMGIFALGALGSKLISFLLLPLYTHLLSAEEYGIADFIFTLGQLLLPFFSLAIFNGLLRYGLMKEVNEEDALYCATKVFVIGSIIAVLVTPLLRYINVLGEWRWYLCIYVITSFALTNSMIYLKVKNMNKLYAVLSIVQTLSLVVFNLIFLLWLNFAIKGYLISYILSNCITISFAVLIGGIPDDLRTAHYQPELFKSMIIFSLPYIVNDICWWAIHSSDKLMIEVFIGSNLLGIYTTASKIPSLINVVTSIFTQAWGLSSIIEYDSTNDTDFYSNVFNYFIIVIFGVFIIVVSFIKNFMKIYVNIAFFESWRFVPVLLFGAVFSGISSFAGSLLGAMKRTQNLMWSTFLAGIVNVIINAMFIPVYGIWGAAIGTLMAYLIVAVCRLYFVGKNLKINFNIRRNVLIVIVAFVQMVLVSLDFHIKLVSAITLFLYLVLISNDLIRISKILLFKTK